MILPSVRHLQSMPDSVAFKVDTSTMTPQRASHLRHVLVRKFQGAILPGPICVVPQTHARRALRVLAAKGYACALV